jgi:cobalt-zinc-cadmium efflux system outer membrane protein
MRSNPPRLQATSVPAPSAPGHCHLHERGLSRVVGLPCIARADIRTNLLRRYCGPLLAAVALCCGLLAGGCRTPIRQAEAQRVVCQTAQHDSNQSVAAIEPLMEPQPLSMPEPPMPLTAASTPLAPPVKSPPAKRRDVGQELATFESEGDGATISTAPAAVADTWEMPMAEGNPFEVDRVITIDEALSYTLANHPVLQAMEHEVEVARAEVVTAGLRQNPHFVFATETPIFRDGPTELGGRVTFPILTGRKRRLRRAAACTGVRRAELAVGRQRQQLLEESAAAAVDVLYLQELVGINAQLSQLATKISTATVSTLSLGQVELKVAGQMAAEIAAADAEARHLSTETQLAVARRKLARTMGLPPPAEPGVAGRLGLDLGQLIPLETVLAIARENRLELAEARVAVSESHQQHAVAHAEAHPDLELGPRYIGPLGEDKDQIGVRLDVDLPLFDRNQGAICQTAAQIRVNRARLRVAELETLSDVAAAHAELKQLQKELNYYNERVAQLTAKTTSLLADPAISRGISDYQELTIQLALAKMRRDRLQLAYRYEQLLTRLQLFLGEPVT